MEDSARDDGTVILAEASGKGLGTVTSLADLERGLGTTTFQEDLGKELGIATSPEVWENGLGTVALPEELESRRNVELSRQKKSEMDFKYNERALDSPLCIHP